jgi:hypothetical protein
MTHTKQKEMMEMKKARVVPNLASTLVGENIKAQVEELLPPQHNVAAASKKALDGGSSTKGKEEEQKSTNHPQVPAKTPGASKKHKDEKLAEAKVTKAEKA